ncbi:low temperature requirement protein A [Actinoplanes sp. M2I2]|uniref:low temperature requirement protein A n=1 Tax=Actinoplanes sp. M2I2 TaxID=1734444 RepID=UPI002020A824|nr:low temperature requirement protein A [Actinoplanes sp. M2I2]
MRPLRARMTARRTDERHRASTPLELLFDLTFVVAAGQIAGRLAHGIEDGRTVPAIAVFLTVFFAIWWSWMNFTWFASGYDTDDVPYRLFTMMQMAGVLILAAGVPAAFDDGDFRGITIGYLIMRAGLVAQWIRAAISDPGHRGGPVRTAVGYSVAQAGWLVRLALPASVALPSAVVLALVDMAVPLWAERAGAASWNPHHIAERYGLFTIILLGESVMAATTAVEEALRVPGHRGPLAVVALSGLTLVFALWWLYYLQRAATGLEQRRRLAYVWGYGHYGIFAALAALGAGLEVAVRRTGHPLEAADVVVSAAVAIPVGVFLLLLWAVHAPLVPLTGISGAVVVPAAAVVLLSPLATAVLTTTGVILVVALACSAVVALTVLRQSRTDPDPVR